MTDKYQVAAEEIEKSIKLIGKTFDAKAFQALMEKFEGKVNEMKTAAKAIRVQGPGSEVKSIEMATIAKKLDKVIDKARMSAKRPYLDFNQSLDGMVRPVQKDLKGIENGEKKKCVAYRNDLLAKQREAEAKEAAKPSKKLDIGGLTLGRPKVVKEATGKVESTSAGSGSYGKVIVPRLVDITKVPAKYLLVDWKAVKAAQKAGVVAIDGIDFVEEIDMTLRS